MNVHVSCEGEADERPMPAEPAAADPPAEPAAADPPVEPATADLPAEPATAAGPMEEQLFQLMLYKKRCIAAVRKKNGGQVLQADPWLC